MIAFLDTEFTELVNDPRLLSIGMVTNVPQAPELYAEVTDPERLSRCSQFARDTVLPQFGAVTAAACSYRELGARTAHYLQGLVDQLGPNRNVVVAFECHLDWQLVVSAILDCDLREPGMLLARISPTNVYNVAGFEAGMLAAEQYFEAQRGAAFRRHHALCDARALRLAYAAALAAHVGGGPGGLGTAQRTAGTQDRAGAARMAHPAGGARRS